MFSGVILLSIATGNSKTKFTLAMLLDELLYVAAFNGRMEHMMLLCDIG